MNKDKDEELDLSNLNLEEINIENSDINNKDLNVLNLDDLQPTEEETPLPSNVILEKSKELTLGLTEEQINEFYDYLAGKRTRPMFAEKFFADGESRIKESNQLTTMMTLSFVPKLLAMEQSLIDSLSSPDSLKYLSADEKISYLNTLSTMSTKFNEIAMKYSQAARDITGVPLVYRQLLDQLLMISGDRLPRLKMIPTLVDLPEDSWQRIVEIANQNK